MSTVTQAFREHHRELSRQLSDYVTALAEGQPDADAQGLAAFLRHELVPHAVGEERQLYPVMDEIVRAHGKPTATMSVDHKYIQDYIAQIEEAAEALRHASPQAQQELRARLTRLGLELRAIFELHLAKEERVYLPLFEQYLTSDEQQQVLDAMHEEHAPEPAHAVHS